MVDRDARDRMIAAIQSYMDERITAFALDDALGKITTQDKTVREIQLAVWLFYDDIKDHRIVASKEQWDYFNRLLLLLQSDGELEVINTRYHWMTRHCVATINLVIFVALAFRIGLDAYLLAVSIPFGLISMLLAFFCHREAEKREQTELSIAPFPSFASLLTVRRNVPSFLRRHYPRSIQSRQIRDPLSRWCLLIPYRVLWLLFAPVVLLIQALPEKVVETRIVFPA